MSRQQPTIRIEADLLLDTAKRPGRAGLLAGSCGRRQLLFRAGDVFLDVSLHRQAGSKQLALVGQLLDAGTASRKLTDLPVELDCANGEPTRTRSNGLGEFLLICVPEGVATLGVLLDRWTSLEVPLPAAAFAAGEPG